MNRTSFSRLFALIFLACLSAQAAPRAFIDDQGRSVEAELVGIRGANVVLATGQMRGQWPLAKLSPPDQAYVREWLATHTAVKHVQVQVTERDGIGERGEFKGVEATSRPQLPEGLPFPKAPEVKASHKHYEIAVNNPAAVDASFLKVAYVVYVIQPDGSIGTQAGVQSMERVAAGGSARLMTEGVSASRTKSTQLKIALTNGTLSVGQKTQRSREQFGGIWVKVSSPDGTPIGELKRLTPSLTQLNPPWQEADVAEEIPVLESLGSLLEKIKKVLPLRSGFPRLPGTP